MTKVTLHTRTTARSALIAAGFLIRFIPSDDEAADDAFALTGDDETLIQISDDDGVWFTPSVYSGEGDDYQVEHGHSTRDPIEAARQALAMRDAQTKAEGLKPDAEVTVVFNRGTVEEFKMEATVIEAQKDMPGFWFLTTSGGSRFVISAEALDLRAAQ